MTKTKIVPRVKNWFTHDWEAKLVSLVLAFLIWFIVWHQINQGKPEMPEGWPFKTAPEKK